MFFDEFIVDYEKVKNNSKIKVQELSWGEKRILGLIVLDAVFFTACSLLAATTSNMAYFQAMLVMFVVLLLAIAFINYKYESIRKARVKQRKEKRLKALHSLLIEKNYFSKRAKLIELCSMKKQEVRGWNERMEPFQTFVSVCVIPASIAALSVALSALMPNDGNINRVFWVAGVYVLICFYIWTLYWGFSQIGIDFFDKKKKLITCMEEDLRELDFLASEGGELGILEEKMDDNSNNVSIYQVRIQRQ